MMKKTASKDAEIRNLEDRSWNLLAEMWVEKKADDASKQLEAEQTADQTAKMDAFFAEYDAKNLQQIEKYANRYARKRFMKNTLLRVAQIAAVWIAVLALAGGIAIAASPTVRVYLTKLLVEVTPQYTSLTLTEDTDNYVNVPAEWQGEYYPSIIPEGLEIGQLDSDAIESIVTYVSPESQAWQIIYEEMTDGSANIDTEDAVITQVKVLGYDAAMSTKDDVISIYWFNGNKLFFLDIRGYSEEEALTIANGLKKIQ